MGERPLDLAQKNLVCGFGADLLAQKVDGHEFMVWRFKAPEGPAIASGQALDAGADFVD